MKALWRRIKTRFDPDLVTTISEREEEAAAGGLDPADVEAIWQSVCGYYKLGLQPAMSLSLRGGVVGLALGAATLGILRGIAAPIEGSLLPTVNITAGAWAVLAALPLLAGLIATITARVTVVRALREMP